MVIGGDLLMVAAVVVVMMLMMMVIMMVMLAMDGSTVTVAYTGLSLAKKVQ